MGTYKQMPNRLSSTMKHNAPIKDWKQEVFFGPSAGATSNLGLQLMCVGVSDLFGNFPRY